MAEDEHGPLDVVDVVNLRGGEERQFPPVGRDPSDAWQKRMVESFEAVRIEQ